MLPPPCNTHLVEGLHADADAADSQRYVCLQASLVKSARVSLDRDLGIGVYAVLSPKGEQDLLEELRRDKRWRLVF